MVPAAMTSPRGVMSHVARHRFNGSLMSGWWLTNPEKYEFVSWDDDISKIWKKMFQTTNQILIGFQDVPSLFLSNLLRLSCRNHQDHSQQRSRAAIAKTSDEDLDGVPFLCHSCTFGWKGQTSKQDFNC